ncbi:MAG: ribosomal protein uS13, partial [Phycisphaeraceae bacterium JB051]
MPRIAGTDIPDNKPIRIALRYVFGVGPKIAEDLLQEVGIEGHVRANTLTEEQCAQISNVIEAKYLVEGALRRQIQQNIGRLRDIRSYRGDRHRRGLPVRGQR